MGRPTADALAIARRYIEEVRRKGFRRLETLAWVRLARCLYSGGGPAGAFLRRFERLLPEGRPGRVLARSIRSAALARWRSFGPVTDGRLAHELGALVRLARS